MRERGSYNPEESGEVVARLAVLLRDRGVEDPEFQREYTAWVVDQEQQADAIGTPQARINFEVARARLCVQGNQLEFARQCYEDALDLAHGHNQPELFEAITEEMSGVLEG